MSMCVCGGRACDRQRLCINATVGGVAVRTVSLLCDTAEWVVDAIPEPYHRSNYRGSTTTSRQVELCVSDMHVWYYRMQR